MPFEEVTGGKTYFKAADWEPGTHKLGFFLKSEPSKNFPDSINHDFRDDNGSVFSVNGSGQLDYLMEQVKPGSYCRVTYVGKEKLTTGTYKGKEAHQWKVAVDPTKQYDGALPAATPVKETPQLVKPAGGTSPTERVTTF